MAKHLKPSTKELTTFELLDHRRDSVNFRNVIRTSMGNRLNLLTDNYWVDKRGQGNGTFMAISELVLGLASHTQALRTVGSYVQEGTYNGDPAQFMFLLEKSEPRMQRISDADFAFDSITARVNGLLGALNSPYRLGTEVENHL